MWLDGPRLLSTCIDPVPHAPPIQTSSYPQSHTHPTISSEAFPPVVAIQLSPPLPHPTPPLSFTCPNHLSLLCLNSTDEETF